MAQAAAVPATLVRSMLATFDTLRRGGDPLELELAASELFATLQPDGWRAESPHDEVLSEILTALAAARSRTALLTLRALAASSRGAAAERATSLADELVHGGCADDPLAALLGRARPQRALRVSDEVDDDVGVLVIEWHHPAGRAPETTLVAVDNTLGGLAVSATVGPRLEVAMEALAGLGAEMTGREVAPDLACGELLEAVERTSMTIGAPTSDDYRRMRSLLRARLDGHEPAAPGGERPSEAERDAMVEAFLASDEASGVRSEYLPVVAAAFAWFACDYVSGTPWRFSPGMVEVFCCDWAPRKLTGEREAFEAIPATLAAWIRFCGRRRGIPVERAEAAVGEIAAHREAMLAACDDPRAWSPAKALFAELLGDGVDPRPPRRERRAKKPRRRR